MTDHATLIPHGIIFYTHAHCECLMQTQARPKLNMPRMTLVRKKKNVEVPAIADAAGPEKQ